MIKLIKKTMKRKENIMNKLSKNNSHLDNSIEAYSCHCSCSCGCNCFCFLWIGLDGNTDAQYYELSSSALTSSLNAAMSD